MGKNHVFLVAFIFCIHYVTNSSLNYKPLKKGAIMNSLELVEAAGNGDTQQITSLLTTGADVNSKDDHGRSALMKAAKYGHKGVVELLIQLGADIHARDNRGTNAVYWAAEKAHNGVVELLIRHGADVDAIDDRGWSALDHARATQNKTLTAILEKAASLPRVM
jgi:ankyrin repeat protein